MAGVLVLAVLFVAVVEVFVGHSNLAFAAAIIALIFANARMLSFNCPECGKNLFFRRLLVVPWPNPICTRCGADMERKNAPTSQNR